MGVGFAELNHDYAGFGRRFLADVLDNFIWGLVFSVINQAWPTTSQAQEIAILIAFVAYLVYYVGLLSSRPKATVGKMAAGIIVTNRMEGKIAVWQSLIRLVAQTIPLGLMSLGNDSLKGLGFILFVIDYVPFFFKTKRTMHDRLAGTIVIRKTKMVLTQPNIDTSH